MPIVPTAPEYATPAEVMARLHLPPTHPDADYVALCTDAANGAIDDYLERPDDDPLVAPYPARVVRSAIGAAIRIYKFQDTGTNLDPAFGTEPIVSLPRDPLAGYVDLLAPYRPGAAWAPT